MLILLVEDDSVLAAQTIDFLNAEGIDVDYAATLASAKEIAAKNAAFDEYDAIVLDMALPDGNALSLMQQTLAGFDAPVLFCTAATALDDKLAAFDAGALDYLTKPFALPELAVRIKLLTGKVSKQNQVFELGDLHIDFSAKIARRGGRTIVLSPQQWQLLALLAEQAPAPVSKVQILRHIWPDSEVNNNMYKSLITRLRHNLSRGDEASVIHTLKGQGVALRETTP
ncbi:DNA-binding response regulator [Pseudoalteromonas rubra]|uniref:DNA-binding response regulator n=1 Tax=Pseudoalteromonas rubra TaxID=43658 RepID=A0A5S3WI26_9GAMM|nr:response regulator transcription factor [Pseudoalteromonas rubra]TMP26863.1 DNA-binding response regulator [Pseudoalteromonas rubra]TMP33752.1 DNA-binding response regulator [Pseudoalteromonas rubra]